MSNITSVSATIQNVYYGNITPKIIRSRDIYPDSDATINRLSNIAPGINCIDIDWNGAHIGNTVINTTSDLFATLSTKEDLREAMENVSVDVDFSYYTTKSELDSAYNSILTTINTMAKSHENASASSAGFMSADAYNKIYNGYFATQEYVNQEISKISSQSPSTSGLSSNDVLDEDLTVMGVTVGNVGTGTTFKAGTPIEKILKEILCKELYPKVSSSPSVKLNGVTTSDVEVGTVYDDKQLGYTFSSGLFAGNNYTLSSTYTATGVSVSSVSYTINNSTSYVIQSTGKISYYDIVSGSNIFKVTVSHTAATNNPVTNLGNSYSGSSLISAGSKSSSVTITGKYYTFYKLFKATDTINAPESSASANGFTKTFTAPAEISIPTSDYTKIIIYTKQTLESKCDYDSGVLAQPWEIVNDGTYDIELPNGEDETYNKYVLSTVEPWAAGKMTNLKYN